MVLTFWLAWRVDTTTATISARVDSGDMMLHMSDDAALPLPGMEAGGHEPDGQKPPKDAGKDSQDKKDKRPPKKASTGPKQARQCCC